MTNRSTCLTYGRTTIITNRCCGSGSSVLMRHVPVAFAQREGVDGAARGDVDDLDLLHLRLDGVEALPVAGHRRARGHARFVRDRAGDLPGGLVDHLEVIREHADIQRAVAGRYRLGACPPRRAADTVRRPRRRSPADGTRSRTLSSPPVPASWEDQVDLAPVLLGGRALVGPVWCVIELVGHLRRPVASDVAVEQVAFDRLAQARGTASAVRLPTG